MTISSVIEILEAKYPLSLQEDYDNAGLLTGNKDWDCSGIIVSLDVTEEVIREAIDSNCNLVVAHHPVIFKGLKKITGKSYVERIIITAIKNGIALYSIHTNLDNLLSGVNGQIADQLSLTNRRILLPKGNSLQKLSVFVPSAHKEQVLETLFATGAGNIGKYSECSFVTAGTGSFTPGENTNPYVGDQEQRHYEKEEKIEVIFPHWLQRQVIQALKASHPYEEPAYDIFPLLNEYAETGSGLMGELAVHTDEASFLRLLKKVFKVPVIRHTGFTGRSIKKIALCGGAGSFLTFAARSAGADVFISSDIKYHEFFDAEGELLLVDIGHYESEQYTIELLYVILKKNFPNFAVLKTAVNTNPVKYF